MTDNEIIRLAQKLNLGRAMKPIGLDTGDVFYTDNSYRTAELLAFADAMQSLGYAEGRKDQEAEPLPPGHYVIRYNDDGEFGQATGWLYREGGEPCAVTGRPVYVWRRLAGLIGGCGCRLGECESKPASCRMAYEAATRDPGVM